MNCVTCIINHVNCFLCYMSKCNYNTWLSIKCYNQFVFDSYFSYFNNKRCFQLQMGNDQNRN